MEIIYRQVRLEDFEEIYAIFKQVIDEGKTYSYTSEEMTPERSLAYWISAHGTHCIVADIGGVIAGVAAIRPNRTGRADHVANASFIVHQDFRGRGIARKLGQLALSKAHNLGYKSMQFNFVVSSNKVAVNLWQSIGFEIIGVMPNGFNHSELGYTDVYIMHQFL
jgi:L-amino acid N-acyltransferase YncA